MALKFRRGTNAGRAAITPAEGEPIYTTDTKQLFIGDGTTAGGVAVGGGGVSDGDKGDVTVSSSGATWTIDNDAVTYAKMQNVSAASKLLGRGSASGSGDVQEITLGDGLTMTGTTLAASGGGGGGLGAPTYVVTKTADETITDSTTMQDDDELFYSLSSGKTYYVQFILMISRSNSTNAVAMKTAIYANSEGYGGIIAATPGNSFVFDGTTALGNSGNIPSASGIPTTYYLQGSIKTTSAYTLQLKFAQNASSATGVTILAKSRLLIWEL